MLAVTDHEIRVVVNEGHEEEEHEVRVVAGIAVRNGTVLMQKRPKGKLREGQWEHPGGKVEPGENPEDALRREWMEELGVPIRVAHYLAGKYLLLERRIDIWFYYVVIEGDAEPQPLEAEELAWVTPIHAIKHLPCTPGSVAVFDRLQRFVESLA